MYDRVQVIAAEGEQKASRALKEAADVISQSPAALQLRYLQSLNMIATEKNSTIIFPLPMDLVRAFTEKKWRYDMRLTSPVRHVIIKYAADADTIMMKTT